MNLATLRLEGPDEAIQTVRDTLGLVADSTYKQGDPKHRGGFHSSSGLGATIADAKNPREMVAAIRKFIAKCQSRNINLAGQGLSSELAIGVTAGVSEQFVAIVDFSTSDLLSLGALGVELSFTAYPTSDEANEIDQDT